MKVHKHQEYSKGKKKRKNTTLLDKLIKHAIVITNRIIWFVFTT